MGTNPNTNRPLGEYVTIEWAIVIELVVDWITSLLLGFYIGTYHSSSTSLFYYYSMWWLAVPSAPLNVEAKHRWKQLRGVDPAPNRDIVIHQRLLSSFIIITVSIICYKDPWHKVCLMENWKRPPNEVFFTWRCK